MRGLVPAWDDAAGGSISLRGIDTSLASAGPCIPEALGHWGWPRVWALPRTQGAGLAMDRGSF